MNLAASTLATSGSPPPCLRHRIRVPLRVDGAAAGASEPSAPADARSDGAAAAAAGGARGGGRSARRQAAASAVAILVLLQLPEGGQLEANVEEGQILRAAEDRERANISVKSEVKQLFLMSASRMWRSKRTPSMVISTGQITACTAGSMRK